MMYPENTKMAFVVEGDFDDDEEQETFVVAAATDKTVADRLATKANDILDRYRKLVNERIEHLDKWMLDHPKPDFHPRIGTLSQQQQLIIQEEKVIFSKWKAEYDVIVEEFENTHKMVLDEEGRMLFSYGQMRRYSGGIWEGGYSITIVPLV